MYPSTISALTNPNPTDRLNAPSHSAIETAQNNTIVAIENFLGVEGASSIVGTLIYDVRSPASNGGGHVQTANKGGTGQTVYTLGDLLVGQSSSVLTRTAVGTNGQILSADSTQQTGVKWIDNSTPKIQTSASVITSNKATETSLLGVNITGSVMGTSNALKATIFGNFWAPRAPITVIARYGGGVVASVVLAPQGFGANAYDSGGLAGDIEFTMIENNSATAQRSFLRFSLASTSVFGVVSSVYTSMDSSASSINSGTTQPLHISAVLSNGTGPETQIGGYIIEKIS